MMVSATLVVTGAASGIGKAVVESRQVAKMYERIVALDRDRDGLQRLKGVAPDLVIAEVDLSDASGIADVIAESVAGELPYRGLVNSAGNHHSEASLRVSVDNWKKVIDVHLTGSFFVSQAVARWMAATGGGAIVNISSIGEFFGLPGRVAYTAAKAGISAMTRSLAVEWASAGIRVNCVAPGYIDTPMGTLGIKDRAATESMHALARFGDPGEVSDAICFLLSDESSFITGEVLRIDGGYSVTKEQHEAQVSPR